MTIRNAIGYIFGLIAGYAGVALATGIVGWANITHWQYWLGFTIMWLGYGEAYKAMNRMIGAK